MFIHFKQIGPLLTMGIQTLPQRKGSSGVVVIGIASVVAVLVSVLAIANGVDRTLRGSGRYDTAILLSSGSDDESDSLVSHADYETITSMPEVATGADGKPLADAEVVTAFPVKFKRSGEEGNVTLRGVGAQGLAIHSTIHVTDGRMFRPGLTELLAGSGVASEFQGFLTGDRVKIGHSLWTVTGHFQSDSVHNSEVLADLHTVQSAMGMGDNYNAVYVRLKSASELPAFKNAIASNPTLHLDAESEPQYFAAQSAGLSGALTVAAYVMGIIMASGALFGAIHSLYISADARRIEMATLRALGFSPNSVMIAFLIEALVLALAGGGIGAAVSWLLFDGRAATSMYGGMSQVVFRLEVSAHLVGMGVIWACAIGLLGALVPAVRASRLPVTEALRR